MTSKGKFSYQFPVHVLYLFAGAVVLTVYGFVQTQGQDVTIFSMVWWSNLIFWFLNYMFWIPFIPIIFHHQLRYLTGHRFSIINVLRVILLGSVIVTTHYILVSSALWLFTGGGSMIDYLLLYFGAASVSHALDWLLITGVLTGFKLYRDNLEKRVSIEKLENELNRAQLQALQNQLRPHFLFNTMNTISAFMGDNEKGQRVISNLSQFLRTTLNSMDAPLILLESELENVKNYLEIEAVRFDEKIEIDIRKNNCGDEQMVPAFILQPIVENAVIHGFGELREKGMIAVANSIEDNMLVLTVSDSGTGIEEGMKEGVGLSNVRKRLLNIYKDEAELRIGPHSESGGCRVDILIPLMNQ